MSRLRLCALALAMALGSEAEAQSGCSAGAAVYMGESFPLGLSFSSDSPLPRRTGHDGTGGRMRHLRLQLRFATPVPEGPWSLMVRDEAFRPLQQIDSEDLGDAETFWTKRVPPKVALDFVRKPAEGTVRVEIVKYVGMPAGVAGRTFYSTQGDVARWESLHQPDSDPPSWIRRLGDSVAMLDGWRGRTVSTCTGFAITPTLLLTNWHCGALVIDGPNGPVEVTDGFWSDDMCRGTAIDFSWDGDEVSREYRCTQVKALDEDLDYALLRIARVEGVAEVVPLRIASTRPAGGDPVMLIHHPRALEKQVSRDCPIGPDLALPSWRGGDMADVRFHHRCDTEVGSSGAPVVDAKGRLIGLHHHGFERDPTTCDPLDRENKAIWIEDILSSIADRAPAALVEIREAQATPQ